MDAVLVCGFFIALTLAAHGMSGRGRCSADLDAAWWAARFPRWS